MGLVKCIECEKEFQDKHPSRKSHLKFCCREHFRKYKQKHGQWNTGKKWEEFYSPETLKEMKARVHAKGKNHFNYGNKRFDTIIRNVTKHPLFSIKKQQEIKLKVLEGGESAINELVANSVSGKDKKERTVKWKKYQHAYRKNKRVTDEQWRLKEYLRTRLWQAFKQYSKNGKIRKADEYGIDYKAIIEHLGPMPKDGREYQIDHIIPISRFDFDDPERLGLLFCLRIISG